MKIKSNSLILSALLAISPIAFASTITSYSTCQAQALYDKSDAYSAERQRWGIEGLQEGVFNALALQDFFDAFAFAPAVNSSSSCKVSNEKSIKCDVFYGWGCAIFLSDQTGVIFNLPLTNQQGKSMATILDDAEKDLYLLDEGPLNLPRQAHVHCTVPKEKVGQLDQYQCELG